MTILRAICFSSPNKTSKFIPIFKILSFLELFGPRCQWNGFNILTSQILVFFYKIRNFFSIFVDIFCHVFQDPWARKPPYRFVIKLLKSLFGHGIKLNFLIV